MLRITPGELEDHLCCWGEKPSLTVQDKHLISVLSLWPMVGIIFVYLFGFGFDFWDTPGCTQVLLLVFHSGITPGSDWGTIWNAGEWT